MRFYFLFLIILLGFQSCKSISVARESHTKTVQSIELGIIGEDKVFVLEEDYNNTAIPVFAQPVKISISVQDFNTSSFKAFSEANSTKVQPLSIRYTDSLASKPKFLKLEIADRVAILEALNSKDNASVTNYLGNKKDAHIISAVSMALSDSEMKSLLEADAVFLEQDGNKRHVVKAYKNNQVLSSFVFSDGVVFAYQASNFCWQEDDKYQLTIVDIVESSDKCPNGTYRNTKRAKKNVDYFKF